MILFTKFNFLGREIPVTQFAASQVASGGRLTISGEDFLRKGVTQTSKPALWRFREDYCELRSGGTPRGLNAIIEASHDARVPPTTQWTKDLLTAYLAQSVTGLFRWMKRDGETVSSPFLTLTRLGAGVRSATIVDSFWDVDGNGPSSRDPLAAQRVVFICGLISMAACGLIPSLSDEIIFSVARFAICTFDERKTLKGMLTTSLNYAGADFRGAEVPQTAEPSQPWALRIPPPNQPTDFTRRPAQRGPERDWLDSRFKEERSNIVTHAVWFLPIVDGLHTWRTRVEGIRFRFLSGIWDAAGYVRGRLEAGVDDEFTRPDAPMPFSAIRTLLAQRLTRLTRAMLNLSTGTGTSYRGYTLSDIPRSMSTTKASWEYTQLDPSSAIKYETGAGGEAVIFDRTTGVPINRTAQVYAPLKSSEAKDTSGNAKSRARRRQRVKSRLAAFVATVPIVSGTFYLSAASCEFPGGIGGRSVPGTKFLRAIIVVPLFNHLMARLIERFLSNTMDRCPFFLVREVASRAYASMWRLEVATTRGPDGAARFSWCLDFDKFDKTLLLDLFAAFVRGVQAWWVSVSKRLKVLDDPVSFARQMVGSKTEFGEQERYMHLAISAISCAACGFYRLPLGDGGFVLGQTNAMPSGFVLTSALDSLINLVIHDTVSTAILDTAHSITPVTDLVRQYVHRSVSVMGDDGYMGTPSISEGVAHALTEATLATGTPAIALAGFGANLSKFIFGSTKGTLLKFDCIHGFFMRRFANLNPMSKERLDVTLHPVLDFASIKDRVVKYVARGGSSSMAGRYLVSVWRANCFTVGSSALPHLPEGATMLADVTKRDYADGTRALRIYAPDEVLFAPPSLGGVGLTPWGLLVAGGKYAVLGMASMVGSGPKWRIVTGARPSAADFARTCCRLAQPWIPAKSGEDDFPIGHVTRLLAYVRRFVHGSRNGRKRLASETPGRVARTLGDQLYDRLTSTRPAAAFLKPPTLRGTDVLFPVASRHGGSAPAPTPIFDYYHFSLLLHPRIRRAVECYPLARDHDDTRSSEASVRGILLRAGITGLFLEDALRALKDGDDGLQLLRKFGHSRVVPPTRAFGIVSSITPALLEDLRALDDDTVYERGGSADAWIFNSEPTRVIDMVNRLIDFGLFAGNPAKKVGFHLETDVDASLRFNV